MSRYEAQWRAITSNRFVLSIISGYKIEFIKIPIQQVVPDNIKLDERNVLITHTLVERLLEIGAVKKVDNVTGQFLSSIFPVPKSNGKHRLIINLKPLNKFVETRHFKMEDWRTVISLLSQNMFMVKIDLKDAYHLVKISDCSKKFLRFNWQNQLYEYQCLPFGFSLAPLLFTKIMKELAKNLRTQGHLSVIYLDDILLFGETREKCLDNLSCTLSLLKRLGFIISEKSELEPTQCIEYLGLIFNSTEMTVSLPISKISRLQNMCTQFLLPKPFTITQVAELIGNLVAACPGVHNGPLYTRQLEVEKTRILSLNGGDYSQSMTLTDEVRNDISWWLENLQNSNPIKSHHYDVVLSSDSSLLAWGATCNGINTRGKWTDEERHLHINCLELLAAKHALCSFVSLLAKKSVLLRLDNKTAISYINRYGGCRSPQLHKIAKELLEWCSINQITLYATYIKSKDNYVADALSRKDSYNSEWMLGHAYFNNLCNLFGEPEIDLFASYNNYQCKKYCSWMPDPSCFHVDAFSLNWNIGFCYAFPPFAVVGKVLQKIRAEKSRVLVVAPNWGSQSWYPYYISMAKTKILYMGPNKKLLTCPYSNSAHPLKDMQLMAAVLCG